MKINATLINLYIVCPRQCWLHANGINMEHTSDIVYDGKLFHESSYPQRAQKYQEVELSAQWKGVSLTGKVDFYDRKDKIIHEIKRGNKIEEAHEWQLKFYIWLFELNGIEEVVGKVEYPKLRLTTDVYLSDMERKLLGEMIPQIQQTIADENCPPVIESKICKRCSYFEFCYSGEV
ncbi:CRISPR-associated protein Cas4 [Flavobacteriaceae bacterium Ap0902]|nr:CRISPR-associated protein Cas4 [Flavobacteriaceae bacterium Ap0902]